MGAVGVVAVVYLVSSLGWELNILMGSFHCR